MFFLMTEAELSAAAKEALRKEFMERTGEDCVILSHGLTIEQISVKKDGAASPQETAQRD